MSINVIDNSAVLNVHVMAPILAIYKRCFYDSHHLLDLYYEFKVLLHESIYQSDSAAGRLRCNSLQLALRQNHHSPVRAVITLQMANHIQHCIIREALT